MLYNIKYTRNIETVFPLNIVESPICITESNYTNQPALISKSNYFMRAVKTKLSVNGDGNHFEKIEMNCNNEMKYFEDADDFIDYLNVEQEQNKKKPVNIIIHCKLIL